jgi:HSP20 family molecular chaperone IbpA
LERVNDWPRDANEGYPPYDIVRKGEDQFQINIAVAGFPPTRSPSRRKPTGSR